MAMFHYSRGAAMVSAHMIDHDADALVRGERVDSMNAVRDLAVRPASRPKYRMTDEHGRSFGIEAVIDGGALMTADAYMRKLRGDQ